jgi:hypothetical protein
MNDTLIDPKEMAADDLAANAAEYEQWIDWCNELEAVVSQHGNPNAWSWK